MPRELATLPQSIIPLRPHALIGIEALRELGTVQTESNLNVPSLGHEASEPLPNLADLMDDLIAPGHGVILTMGKGGVGKTTIAAAIAIAIAERGFDVHLSTTDPAAHLQSAINHESLPNLTVERIDPKAETVRYAEEVMQKAGANLDSKGRALLEEDLRSPCTEENRRFPRFC